MRIAFLGLGVMGYPMAGHLAQAGHEVTVYNRTATRAQRWCEEFPGARAATPAEAARDAEALMLCVGNDDDVREVLLGADGALERLPEGSLLIDHTTDSARLAVELHGRAAARGIAFLDAPVSGGQAGAESAALTIMVGGTESDFRRGEPLLNHYARRVRLLGAAGSGQLAKMVNQICIAGVLQGLAEAFAFSERAGLDTAAVVDVISAGAAQSWQMENRYRTMLAGEYEHGFAVDWMRKDLALVLEAAQQLDLDLPVTRLVDGFYGEIQAAGGNRWDTSSLFERMRRLSRDSGGDRRAAGSST